MIPKDEIPDVPCISDLMPMFLIDLATNAAPATFSQYKRELNAFNIFMVKRHGNSITADQMDPSDIHAFIVMLDKERGLGRFSRSQALSAIRRWSKWMLSNGFVRSMVAYDVECPRRLKRLSLLPTSDKICSLIDSLNDEVSCWVARDKAMLDLLYSCAFASSELVRSNVTDINWAEQTIKIHNDYGIEREVPMGDVTAESLRLYLRERQDRIAANRVLQGQGIQALFVSATLWTSAKVMNPRYSLRSLDRQVKHIAVRGGLSRKTTPYTFRLAFGVHMFENGADAMAITELMGLRCDSTMKIIRRLSTNRLKAEMDRTHPRAHRKTDGEGTKSPQK